MLKRYEPWCTCSPYSPSRLCLRQASTRQHHVVPGCQWSIATGAVCTPVFTQPLQPLAHVTILAPRLEDLMGMQVVFTKPAVPEAGQACEVFYNPDVSVLRGRPEAWLRSGWNRCSPCHSWVYA